MKSTLLGLGLLVVATIFFGEGGWLCFVVGFVGRVALWGSWPLARRGVAVALGVAVIAGHCAGFKFYGSAVRVDNRPVLAAPHRVVSLVAPNIVVTADGTRFALQGITFSPQLLAVPAEDLIRWFDGLRGPALVQNDPGSPSGVAMQRRLNYPCGNTFFPTFFPERLPAYTKADFGKYLLDWHLATAEDPEWTHSTYAP